MTEGDRAWLGLLAYVVGYDAWALATRHETLSASFDRALRHPIRSVITLLAWGALTAHLFDPAIRRALRGET
jgi:hypothetical protein